MNDPDSFGQEAARFRCIHEFKFLNRFLRMVAIYLFGWVMTTILLGFESRPEVAIAGLAGMFVANGIRFAVFENQVNQISEMEGRSWGG